MSATASSGARKRERGGPRSSSRSSSSARGGQRGAATIDGQAAGRPEHIEALRALRLKAARMKNMPAFRVLTDAGLFGLAAARPQSLEDILQVRGIGPKFVERHGSDVLRIFQGDA